MKLAIHERPGSFSDRWIEYCEINSIPYKIVDCYRSDILDQLSDCDGLMWHWTLMDYKSALFARQFTLSIKELGIKMYPDFNTSWHYNDKLGQKYLLESIKAPLVPSYVFYTKEDALNWINKTTFPKVFKLSGGASSVNVKLIKNRQQAIKIAKKAFSKGFKNYDRWANLRDRIHLFLREKNTQRFISVLKGFGRLVIPTEYEKMSHRDKGYVYFQDFLPNNEYDTRLIVIGNRCFAVRRYNRKDDFRASGSGIKAYEPELFDKRCFKIAYQIAEKLKTQSIAIDFIWDGDNPVITEISYCFVTGSFYEDCMGFWDKNHKWHDQPVFPQYFIIEDFINSITSK
jgi:hypothetical protein